MSNSRNSRDVGPLIRGVEHIAIATTEPQRLAFTEFMKKIALKLQRVTQEAQF